MFDTEGELVVGPVHVRARREDEVNAGEGERFEQVAEERELASELLSPPGFGGEPDVDDRIRTPGADRRLDAAAVHEDPGALELGDWNVVRLGSVPQMSRDLVLLRGQPLR